MNALESPRIGDMKQDEHGEVYVYTGSEWRRVVTPEKHWNDLTGQDLCDLEVTTGWTGDSHEFEVIVKAVIAAYKEKNK